MIDRKNKQISSKNNIKIINVNLKSWTLIEFGSIIVINW